MGAGASQDKEKKQENQQQQESDAPQTQQTANDGAAQEHKTAAAKVQAVNAFKAPPKKEEKKQEDDEEDDEAAWQREKEKLQQRMKDRREKEERDRQRREDDNQGGGSNNQSSGNKDSGGGGGSGSDKPKEKKKRLLNGANIEYKYPSGSSYVGGFKDGKLHGFGKYKYHPSGDVYEGEWLADMKHGQGSYTYEGGDRYTGEWRAGKKHGKGTYIFQTGDEYVGSWKEDKIHGHGVFSIARNGNRYEGNWEESYRHGHGVLKSGNGDLYEGNWVRGKEEGPGVLTYRDGNIYAGDWRSGQMDGKGILCEKDQKYTVEHIAGYPISKVPVEADAVVDPDWNNANRLYEAHLKKKAAAQDGGGAAGGGGGDSDQLVKLKLERDMFEKKYNDLLNRKATADDDFDDDDNDIESLRTQLARAREARDMEKIRADDAVSKEKVLVAEVQELQFKLEECKSKGGGGGGGGGGDSNADLEKMQRKCAELEKQLQLYKQKNSGGGNEGLDALELKAKLELQESEMKSLKASRDELKKVREQNLDNQKTIMDLETRNEELLKEVNVIRQRQSNLQSQLTDAQVSSEQKNELKELRKEVENLQAAVEKAEEKVKKAKKNEKAMEERARKAEELEIEVARLKQSKQTGDAISFKTLDKKSDEVDKLREKNAELQRRLEEMGAEAEGGDVGSPSPVKKDKKKKKKKGEPEAADDSALNAEELMVRVEGLQSDLKKEKKKLKRITAERDVYEQQLLADQASLRSTQRQLSVAHGKVMVYTLVRQLLPFEVERGDQAIVVPGEQAGVIENKHTQEALNFDEVFAEGATGADLFKEAQPTVRKVVEGSHAAIVSFGPMEAGKTFYSSQVAPLAIEELFNTIATSQLKVSVTCTALEVTQDGIIDLNSGNSGPSSVELRKNGYGVTCFVGATALPCANQGEASRAYAAALSCKTKQRSHFAFFLEVELHHPVTEALGRGKLSIIDLAGPGELGRQSDIISAKYVNNSIRSMGSVFSALAEKQQSIPYLNEPITTLLSDVFGGNARTHVFTHCSPSSYAATDTMHSLQLASKIVAIYNKPLRHFDTRDMARLRGLVANACSAEDAQDKDYEITTYTE